MSNMAPDEKKFYEARIGNIQLVFLILIFGPLYALQFILNLTILLSLIAAFIGFVATLGLTLYFKFKHVYVGKKNAGYKLVINLATWLIEIFPELDFIPADLLNLGAMFLISRFEDREIAKEKAKAAASIAREQQQRALQYAEGKQRQQQQQLQTQIEQEDADVIESYKSPNYDNTRQPEDFSVDGEELAFEGAT